MTEVQHPLPLSEKSSLQPVPVSVTIPSPPGKLSHRGSSKLIAPSASNPSSSTTEWRDIDVFASYKQPGPIHRNNNSLLSMQLALPQHDPFTLTKRLWRLVDGPILLALIGLTTAAVATLLNLIVLHIRGPLRHHIVQLFPSIYGFITYTLFAIFFCYASLFCTQRICPDARGGGIPEVVTVMAGVTKRSTLSPKLLIAKFLGLGLALISGISVGKEGPFVHMSCCIADLYLRLPWFESIRLNDSKRLQVLGCATAAGVAATFGTPFGAVLFSIEVTAFCYMVHSLPKAFFCAMCGSLFIFYTRLNEFLSLFTHVSNGGDAISGVDIALAVLLGTVCGVLGVAFVESIGKLSTQRNLYFKVTDLSVLRRREAILVCSVVTLVAPLIYFDLCDGLRGDSHTLSNYLFSDGIIGLGWKLIMYLPYKFIVIVLCVVLPLPVGLFTPVFLIGGGLGRIFGEFIVHFAPSITSYHPWEFAVIGSAAYAAGVTRAVSTAVILFELSGETHLRLPLGVAILVAYFIADRFTKNVYETLIDTNGTPYLPHLHPEDNFKLAREVMTPIDEFPHLSLDSTYEDARVLLEKYTGEMVPVVQSNKHRVLVGAVRRSGLKQVVALMEHVIHSREDRVVLGKYASFEETPALHRDRSVSYSDEEMEGVIDTFRQFTAQRAETSAGEATDESQRDDIELPPRTTPAPASILYPEMDWAMPIQFVMYTGQTRITPIRGRHQSRRRASQLSHIIAVLLDPSPYQVLDSMHLSKVDLSFRMLKINFAYVTSCGVLEGVITRERLRKYLMKRELRPGHLVSEIINQCCC